MPQQTPTSSLVDPCGPVQHAAPQRPIDRVRSRLKMRGRDAALCPHHDDRNASLSVKEGPDGRALLHCHSGCATADVIADLGLSWVDLFPAGSRERQRARTWRGVVPMASHGRPALESFGDDVAAALLAEIGRMAHVRDRLDVSALRSLAILAGASGTTKAAMRESLAAALGSERTLREVAA